MKLSKTVTTLLAMGMFAFGTSSVPVMAATTTTPAYTKVPASGIVAIRYLPGYGVAVWTSPVSGKVIPGKKLPHSSNWKITGYAIVNQKLWFNLGGNQWVSSDYAHQVGDPEKVEIKEKRVVTINYVKGYGIAVWASPDSKSPIKGKTLKTGTRWLVTGELNNGILWLHVGTNQWIQGYYTK